MSKEPPYVWIFGCFGASGLLSLLRLLDSPSAANIRTLDIIRLIATGMCLGAALVALVLFFVYRGRRAH